MRNFIILFFLTSFLSVFGCQNQTEQTRQPITMQSFESGPQLVKIPVNNSSVADSLINLGIDVIVIEKDYIIARMERPQVAGIQTMALKMETPNEIEMVQRLVRIFMTDKADLKELSDTGIDIWEVKGDTVIGQAFDKYIRQIKNKGFNIEIIENDIRNLLKK